MHEFDQPQIFKAVALASVTGKMTVPDKVLSGWRYSDALHRRSSSPLCRSIAAVAMAGCGDRSSLRSAVTMPSRKAIVEICPSPTARSDSKMRTLPSRRPDWSGWRTTLGFINAAAAIAIFVAEIGGDQALGFAVQLRPFRPSLGSISVTRCRTPFRSASAGRQNRREQRRVRPGSCGYRAQRYPAPVSARDSMSAPDACHAR